MRPSRGIALVNLAPHSNTNSRNRVALRLGLRSSYDGQKKTRAELL